MHCAIRPIVQSYRDLLVWKKSIALVLAIYRSTQAFPKIEPTVSSLKCAAPRSQSPATSPKANPDCLRENSNTSWEMPRGSLAEVETQIVITKELAYLQPQEAEGLLSAAAEVGRILNCLISSPARK
jgi:23S rRNA-intervening sequence protein